MWVINDSYVNNDGGSFIDDFKHFQLLYRRHRVLFLAQQGVRPFSSALVIASIHPQIAKEFTLVDSEVWVAEDDVHLVVRDGFLVFLGGVDASIGKWEDDSSACCSGLRLEGGFSVSSKDETFGGFDDEDEVFLAVDVFVDVGFVVLVETV